jgi:hypothetical protein
MEPMINGFESAVDASSSRRPGVPEERDPAPVGNAHWMTPEKQRANGAVLKDAQREELSATFGTGQPPHGFSGLIRTAAYRIPDYEVRRWALLLLADRVDAVESRVVPVLTHPATPIVAVAVAAFAALAATRLRKKRRGFLRALFE